MGRAPRPSKVAGFLSLAVDAADEAEGLTPGPPKKQRRL